MHRIVTQAAFQSLLFCNITHSTDETQNAAVRVVVQLALDEQRGFFTAFAGDERLNPYQVMSDEHGFLHRRYSFQLIVRAELQ
ncbi:MAG: hypothetical protein U5O39_11685 [Gammaproteobacteria bacterium]|nr:hypothetical protein [Gammaproteobacteria bacterium]